MKICVKFVVNYHALKIYRNVIDGVGRSLNIETDS